MSNEDLEKQILEKDTITAEILQLFKINNENKITVQFITKAFEIKDTTAWGVVSRLNKMGLIKKVERGVYIYQKELDKKENIEIDLRNYNKEPTQKTIDININKNLREFYEDENIKIKYKAIQNITMVSSLYPISHNKKIWELINKLPNEIESQFQHSIIDLIKQIINFERNRGTQEKINPKTEGIIKKVKKTLLNTLLSEQAHLSARKGALDILLEFVNKEVIEVYLKIMRIDEKSWRYFAYGYQKIIEEIKDTKSLRDLFLEEVEELYVENDEMLYQRGNQIYTHIRKNYYKEFFLLE